MITTAFDAVTPAEQPFEFIVYKAYEGVLPDNLEDCDAYFLTGSRFSVFDNGALWINPLRDFIVRLNKAKIKTIAVCFGHQLMAEAMGGKVERADCGWQIGVHTATVQVSKDYMQPQAQTLRVAMMCEDQIHELPSSAEIIATMPACEYAWLQYGDHFLSTQSHPEFSQAFARAVINVRQGEFPSKRLENGLRSFSQGDLDGLLIFQWFVRFLTTEAEPQGDD